ncbi:hypothetical protein SQW19_08805 [Stenotrophomonas acidaminiphila]|uniref:hypothetical protein n=1 Tax=Stenotrophomonas acidaminiphila TaxID=128780 RepID=UPI0028AF1326|nr:hypothetical protein [Stenotrophomonas acidaminiphila]WPU54480.1 hypothetical protein SQW19_08805 [Stenotrophomonas acidaminiphila]
MKKYVAAMMMAGLWAGMAGNARAGEPDAAVGRLLDSLEYKYEIDEDGDYRLVFDMDDDRTQLVFVRSTVETYGAHRVREIWSPAYKAPGPQLPALVANRLLEDANDSKLGGWVKQGDMAMFVVKIDANAKADVLSDAIDAAIKSADAMELELTAKDEY